MNNRSVFLLILFIILVCLIWKNDIINRPIVLLPSLVGFLLILSIIDNDKTEHMTNEAISNCSSLFNGGNGKVQNLEITGKISSNMIETKNNIINFANGWAIDASDGNMRFKFNGEQQMVIHNNKTGSPDWDNVVWSKQQKIGSWKIKDAGEIQFVKDGGGYAVFQTDGNMWTQPSGSFKDVVNWKNFVVNGQGGKRNGDKGYGWNAKCGLTTTPGGCTDMCPDGYYMSGISAGKEWDHKHPICTKFS